MTKFICQVCGMPVTPANLGYINNDGGLIVECRGCHTAPRRIPKNPVKTWKVTRAVPRLERFE